VNEHRAGFVIDQYSTQFKIKCSYDPDDPTRPCWPYTEEGDPEPAPQSVCTWSQWADELGVEVLGHSVEIIGMPVTVIWDTWDAPSFFINDGVTEHQAG
jgi:hypothetical protein